MGGLIALAVLSGAVALYWTRQIGLFVRRAMEENLPGTQAAELERTLDRRIAGLAWADGISMALVAVAGAVLIWLLFRLSLRRIRDQLFEAERLALAGKLAASMVHEIRSPLTAIKMWLFAIRTAVRPDAELNRKFEVVTEEMARLEGIVFAYLEFSRAAAPVLRPQCIASIIDKTANLACHQIRHKQIHFVCDNPLDLPPVMADPPQLQQVLLNLLNNSVEATPEGGEIRFRTAVEADRGGRSVVVRVQDTGPGIPPEVRSRLFEPFSTTKERGTGLGLYIATQIMARLGGKLVLENSTPQGTSFAVWVPTAKAAES